MNGVKDRWNAISASTPKPPRSRPAHPPDFSDHNQTEERREVSSDANYKALLHGHNFEHIFVG